MIAMLQNVLPPLDMNFADYVRTIGIAGIFTILVLQLVFSFINKQRDRREMHPPAFPPQCPLNATIELWQSKITEAVVEGLKKGLSPMLNGQTKILETVVMNQGKIMEYLIREDERTSKSKE